MINCGRWSIERKCHRRKELCIFGTNRKSPQISLAAKNEYVMSKQIYRSGTSIGANVAEAQRGQSKADFVAKMSIALKEANETEYWLKLLYRTQYLSEEQHESMNRDIQELIGILVSICRTGNANK